MQAMADGLVALGIECTLFPDGIDIRGGKLLGGTVNSEGDHRIAMAFAMASLRSEGPITIRNCANIATSFPGFTELAAEAGVNLKPVTPQAE